MANHRKTSIAALARQYYTAWLDVLAVSHLKTIHNCHAICLHELKEDIEPRSGVARHRRTKAKFNKLR